MAAGEVVEFDLNAAGIEPVGEAILRDFCVPDHPPQGACEELWVEYMEAEVIGEEARAGEHIVLIEHEDLAVCHGYASIPRGGLPGILLMSVFEIKGTALLYCGE